jgi:hypothetical protein
MILWSIIVMSFGLVAGADIDTHRTDLENLLKKGRIVATKDVGSGVTKPLKVTLSSGDREIKAIFKSVDTRMKTQARHGAESADYYIDSYKSELAAYALDKLIGLNQLPAIVERRVKGKKGSLRVWIDDVKPRYGTGLPFPKDERAAELMHAFWLFDYLVYNVDRGTHNVMLASDWSPVNIDNSMTFNTYVSPIRPLYRFPKKIVARLRTLDDKQIKRALGRSLNRKQRAALTVRITTVLEAADGLVASDGEDAVYYTWKP